MSIRLIPIAAALTGTKGSSRRRRERHEKAKGGVRKSEGWGQPLKQESQRSRYGTAVKLKPGPLTGARNGAKLVSPTRWSLRNGSTQRCTA
jgi:hypothetical protein